MSSLSSQSKPFSYQKHEYTSIMKPVVMSHQLPIHLSQQNNNNDDDFTKNHKQTRNVRQFLMISLVGLFVFFSSMIGYSYQFNNEPVEGGVNMVYKVPVKYHTVIELSMPYLGLVEPFEIWSDMDAGLQHMDYWGTLNRFYLNRSGPGCQIMPISVDGKSSVEINAQIPLWEPAVVFPDLNMPHSPFTKVLETAQVRGVDCEVWELEEKNYNPEANGYVGRYQYFISKNEKRPMKMSFVGHNTITNSHFDNYTFDYLVFEDDFNSVSIKELVLTDGCSNSPTLYFDDDRSGPRLQKEEKVKQAEKDSKVQLSISGDTNGPTNSNQYSSSMLGIRSVTNHLTSLMPGDQAKQLRTQAWNDYQNHMNSKQQTTENDDVTRGQMTGKALNTIPCVSDRMMLLRNTQRIVTSTNHQHLSYQLEVNNMADWTEYEKSRRRGKATDQASETRRVIAEKTARMGGILNDFNTKEALRFATSNEFDQSNKRQIPNANDEVEDGDGVVENLETVVSGKAFNDLHLDDDSADDKTTTPLQEDISDTTSIQDEIAQLEDHESNILIQDISQRTNQNNKDDDDDAIKKKKAALLDTMILSELTGELLDLPKSVDWRNVVGRNDNGEEYGVVGKVKDQGTCGSCWTFGTAGAIETHASIKQLGIDPYDSVTKTESPNGENHGTTPARVTLSEQSIVDCAWPFGVQGCDGGEDDLAYLWVMDIGGIPTTKAYGPYLNADAACHANGTFMRGSVAIQGYYQVPPNSPNLLKAALAYSGPVSVTIDASPPSFYYYSGGVYKPTNAHECNSNIRHSDHIVMLVGYGVDDETNEEYWLLRNSWSEYWGESGYMRLAIHDNPCGAANKATFPILA